MPAGVKGRRALNKNAPARAGAFPRNVSVFLVPAIDLLARQLAWAAQRAVVVVRHQAVGAPIVVEADREAADVAVSVEHGGVGPMVAAEYAEVRIVELILSIDAVGRAVVVAGTAGELQTVPVDFGADGEIVGEIIIARNIEAGHVGAAVLAIEIVERVASKGEAVDVPSGFGADKDAIDFAAGETGKPAPRPIAVACEHV